MSFNSQNLCEDWGWYIDIENTNHLTNNIRANFTHISNKKFSLHLNKLDTIEEVEDQYDYYIKTYNSLDEESIDKNNKKDNFQIYNIVNIHSIIITVSITYVLFFIL
jgi:hypothetical protein